MEPRDNRGGSYRGGTQRESQQQNSGNSRSSRNQRKDRRRRWSDIRQNNRGQGYNRFRGSARQYINSDDRHNDQGPGYANSFQKFRDTNNPFANNPQSQMGAANDKFSAEHPNNYASEPLASVPTESHILLNTDTPTHIELKEPAVSKSTSSSSSDSEGSEDSAVRSLKREVNKTLQTKNTSNKETNNAEVIEKPKQKSAEAKQAPIKSEVSKEKSNDSALNVKKEQTSKSDKSSSSSTSSSSDSSSDESEAENNKNPSSVEDVICLGNLEKFEDLVEDEEVPGKAVCALCDKSGHISFHCQMICKNCNGKHHGLKDCPKPVNLAIVFSNFLQFCLKQSWKYNPNAEFSVDEVTCQANLKVGAVEKVPAKRKSRPQTPKSTRKRHKSTTSESSDSNSESTPTKRKKRRSNKSDGIQTPLTIPFTVPFQPSFNSFGMAPSGTVNPLLAFSHMMGYNPASLDFRGNMIGKDQH